MTERKKRETKPSGHKLRDAAREYNTDWRTAAYIVALSRLEKVYRERGIFP
jgi:glutamate dehydrogenase (NAD(P)+)